MLNGKNILVTGGTGSFGQFFVEEVLRRYKPNKLVIYSRDELKQSQMAERVQDPALRYMIGDVRDVTRLTLAMRDMDFVVHAAALKQVPTAEYNPIECIRTNVLGAENVVQAALANGVQRIIAMSTDKAASPINLYGASKLASDKVFIAANNLSGSIGTRMAVVRYGNVLGSRGSVLPLYLKLIQQGARRLPITDPRMTRFWITLRQGVDFVISCFERMQGGEIFVPKIPSMAMVDFARALAPELEPDFIGIRPGEKLHEVMITEDDSRYTYDLGDCYVIEPSHAFYQRSPCLGERVPEGFRYASDINPDKLSGDRLWQLLLETDARTLATAR